MLILFDHNIPAPLRSSLQNFTVATAAERGWERLQNGMPLQGFAHQQNIAHRRIGIIILSRGNWPDVKVNIPRILRAIDSAKPGICALVECEVNS
jgi:hypothetical protein